MKTYSWDPFIARQVRRWQAIAGDADLYVSYDRTGGDPGSLPVRNLLLTDCATLVSRGLANRAERGHLLWWNADYAHYDLLDLATTYDFYVFAEYDSLFRGDLQELVRRLSEDKVDLGAFPLRSSVDAWYWSRPHLQTYDSADLRGCLMCICVLSRPALEMLRRRRLEMRDEAVPYWPSAEAFLPTEVHRGGMTWAALSDYADATQFDFDQPVLEEDTGQSRDPAFFHPVYDRKRYVRWALSAGTTPRTFLGRQSPVMQRLARLKVQDYLPALSGTVARTALASMQSRLAGGLSSSSAERLAISAFD